MKRRLHTMMIAAISIIAVMVTGCGSSQSPEKVITVENIKDAKVGDVIKFGSYEQDNNMSNGNEPIEWIVLEELSGKRLLLSKYVLDGKPYNGEPAEVYWENCTLRSWLNDDFYNTAFSDSEKQRIITGSSQNPDTYEIWSIPGMNIKTGASGGNKTSDKVFLLSWEDAKSYFDLKVDPNESRIGKPDQKLFCEPTAYARTQVLTQSNNCCGWWLRSPGFSQSEASLVNENGELATGKVEARSNGVRPAIIIE
ncbi:MAG: hypothetical protein IJI65_01080 [Lachnospiraceae bacterium]|nr:hypothetical protein [Lachnospiraceae bacterium]